MTFEISFYYYHAIVLFLSIKEIHEISASFQALPIDKVNSKNCAAIPVIVADKYNIKALTEVLLISHNLARI